VGSVCRQVTSETTWRCSRSVVACILQGMELRDAAMEASKTAAPLQALMYNENSIVPRTFSRVHTNLPATEAASKSPT
jgi:hypothetical protein